MYFTIIFFALFGLQLVGTVKSQSCGEAVSALNDNSECDEAFQAFNSNTTSESPLCTGECLDLVSSMVFECGEEYVELGSEIATVCEVWHTSCIEAFAELQYDNDCAVAVHTGMASEACVGTCRDKLYTLVINCDGMYGFPTTTDFKEFCGGASGIQSLGFFIILLATLTIITV